MDKYSTQFIVLRNKWEHFHARKVRRQCIIPMYRVLTCIDIQFLVSFIFYFLFFFLFSSLSLSLSLSGYIVDESVL